MEGKDVAHWGSHPRHPVLVLPEGASAGPLALCPGRADCTDLAVPARGPPGTTGPLPMLSGHLCPSRCLVSLPPRLVRPGPLPGTSRGAGAVRHRDCPRGLPCWPCFEGTPSPTRRLSPGTAKLALTFPARCSGRTEQREAVVPGHGRRTVLVTGPPPPRALWSVLRWQVPCGLARGCATAPLPAPPCVPQHRGRGPSFVPWRVWVQAGGTGCPGAVSRCCPAWPRPGHP